MLADDLDDVCWDGPVAPRVETWSLWALDDGRPVRVDLLRDEGEALARLRERRAEVAVIACGQGLAGATGHVTVALARAFALAVEHGAPLRRLARCGRRCDALGCPRDEAGMRAGIPEYARGFCQRHRQSLYEARDAGLDPLAIVRELVEHGHRMRHARGRYA